MAETQNTFRYGRSGKDPTLCLKLLIGKGREFNWETHLEFIDVRKRLITERDRSYLACSTAEISQTQ